MMSDSIAKSVLNVILINERILFISLQTTFRRVNIIHIHALISVKSNDELENFYNSLDEAINLTKKGEITFVMGDFSTKIGEEAQNEYSGAFSFGV